MFGDLLRSFDFYKDGFGLGFEGFVGRLIVYFGGIGDLSWFPCLLLGFGLLALI